MSASGINGSHYRHNFNCIDRVYPVVIRIDRVFCLFPSEQCEVHVIKCTIDVLLQHIEDPVRRRVLHLSLEFSSTVHRAADNPYRERQLETGICLWKPVDR